MKIINRKSVEANRAEERKEFAGKAQMSEVLLFVFTIDKKI